MILVLDNYDSFVHNLARYIRQAGEPARVVRSDSVSVEEILNARPDGVLISPGPHRPETAGCCIEFLKAEHDIPVLGVCLGHQAIGVAFGATLHQCPPMHGLASLIKHDEQGLFKGLPQLTPMARYHSLALEESTVKSPLQVTARSDDGTVMGVRHQKRSIEGVQFHPESILSECGRKIVDSFVSQVQEKRALPEWVQHHASVYRNEMRLIP
ncbi:MAG: aminodeoxychorismate/anthranilate synthase component II [Planctomycetota bacterium]